MSRTNKIKQPSPSAQLRTIFYKLYEKDDEGFESFDPYYDSKMHKLIVHYKKMI